MAHPSGIVVDIVGTNMTTNGRSCECHSCCGSVLEEDMVVRFRLVQVIVKGQEEDALAVYWVTGGVDRCRVGFLPRHLVKHHTDYNLKLAQITTLLKQSDNATERASGHHRGGVVRATLIQVDSKSVSTTKSKKRKQVDAKC